MKLMECCLYSFNFFLRTPKSIVIANVAPALPANKIEFPLRENFSKNLAVNLLLTNAVPRNAKGPEDITEEPNNKTNKHQRSLTIRD